MNISALSSAARFSARFEKDEKHKVPYKGLFLTGAERKALDQGSSYNTLMNAYHADARKAAGLKVEETPQLVKKPHRDKVNTRRSRSVFA